MSLETWTSEGAPGFPGVSSARTVPRRDLADLPTQAAHAKWIVLGLSVFTLLVFSRAWITVVVGPEGDAEASALSRNLFVPAYLSALLLAVGDWRRSLTAAKAGVIPIALVLMAFLSCAWSIAPDLSFRRALALSFSAVAAVALAARLDWRDLARVLATTFGVLAAGSLILAVAAPQMGQMQVTFPGAWRGLWSDKNALGDYMALGVFSCIGAAVLDRRLRALWLATGGLCLVLIALSTSKTSLVALGAGAGALALLALARRSAATATATLFGGGVLGLVGGLAFALKPHLIFDLLHKDVTLTGRTEIWTAVLRRVAERPLTGFGYSVVWDDPSGWGPLAWIAKDTHFLPRHSHNSWLELELELGVAGVGLLALFAVQAVWRSMRAGRGVWLAAPILAAFGVATLTETVALNYNDFVWVIVPALVIRLGMRDAPATDPQSRAAARPWSA